MVESFTSAMETPGRPLGGATCVACVHADVRYGLAERHCVLGLDAGRMLRPVRGVGQLLRGLINQREARGGGKLEEIPEVDHDGDATKAWWGSA